MRILNHLHSNTRLEHSHKTSCLCVSMDCDETVKIVSKSIGAITVVMVNDGQHILNGLVLVVLI